MNLAELRAKYAALLAANAELVAPKDGKIPELAEEAQAKFDANHVELEKLAKTINNLEQVARFTASATSQHSEQRGQQGTNGANLNGAPFIGTQSGVGTQGQFSNQGGSSNGTQSKLNTPEHRDAANRYITSRGNHRELFISTADGSGVLLPKRSAGTALLIPRPVNAYRSVLAAIGMEPLSTTDTADILWPIISDTQLATEGEHDGIVATGGATNMVRDPTIANATMSGKLYSSETIPLSNTMLLANPNIPWVDTIQTIAQRQIDRKQEADFTAAIIAVGAGTLGVQTAAATPTLAELIAWQHAMVNELRATAVFLLADTLVIALRSMLDASNRPLWQDSLADGVPSRLFGQPAFICSSLGDTATAGATIGIAISAETMMLRDTPNRLTVYRDQIVLPDQTGYRVFTNHGFAFAAAGAKRLQRVA